MRSAPRARPPCRSDLCPIVTLKQCSSIGRWTDAIRSLLVADAPPTAIDDRLRLEHPDFTVYVGVQRQVAADLRTLHATAALARHALPVCRVMALALGIPPGDGAFRRSFHRVVPFLVRKTSRRTWSGA